MTQGRMDSKIEINDDFSAERIKKDVMSFETYFKKNYDMFNNFRIMIFDSSLSARDRQVMSAMKRPTLEANMLPAYVYRLMGEFAAQEFAFEVNPDDDLVDKLEPLNEEHNQPNQQNQLMQSQTLPSNNSIPVNQSPEKVKDIKLSEVLGHHLNHFINASQNHDLQYSVMKDLLTGGWSVIECELDYEHAMSMVPKFRLSLPEDRTLCGFDPTARLEDKSDGNYCYKKFVMTKSDFAIQYPEVDISGINFESPVTDSPWAYSNNEQDVIIVCDYWRKEKKTLEIVKLYDGEVIPFELYKRLKNEGSSIFMVGIPRTTIIEKIVFYRSIENQIIETRETLFKKLPLIFVRGSGEYLKRASNEAMEEHCLPYAYHAKDAQRFKNYTLNSIANEIENVIQHKLIVAQEALPTQAEWRAPFFDYQNASVLFVKTRYDDNPDQIIQNPITPVPRMQAPPEIMQAYMESDRTIQNLLGASDNAIRTNNQDISGDAIEASLMSTNPTAMPYVTGMAHGLRSVAQAYIDTLPELIHHYNNLPIRDEKSKSDRFKLTAKAKKQFTYYPNQMHVDIKVGASYAIQKQQSLMMVANLIKMAPPLQQFFSTEGLPYILDNMEGKNIDGLKLEVEDWVNQQSQMQQQQSKMAMQQQQQEMQNNPALLRAHSDQQKVQLDDKKIQLQYKIDMLKLELEHNRLDAELHMSARKDAMEIEKTRIEHNDRTVNTLLDAEDLHHKHSLESSSHLLEHTDMAHRHAKETAETIHLITEKPDSKKE